MLRACGSGTGLGLWCVARGHGGQGLGPRGTACGRGPGLPPHRLRPSVAAFPRYATPMWSSRASASTKGGVPTGSGGQRRCWRLRSASRRRRA
eukprot:14890724-Alexandrium_andersonii.AAC.1